MFFSKYQAAGNDFIIIDDRSGSFPLENKSFIEDLCSRKFGIGADGLVLLQNSSSADFRMRIFNLDGLEASMCGNALRCIALYLNSLGFFKDSFLIEAESGVFSCQVIENKVSVQFPIPKILHRKVVLDGVFAGEIDVVDSGVPHAVIFVEDLDAVLVEELGRAIRIHPFFAPEGVNVNFIQENSPASFRIRTYERGVEGETLACGTGAVAAAFVFFQQNRSFGSLEIIPLSGESLICSMSSPLVNGIEITGPASFVFKGEIEGFRK